jgi:hypothetical protein
MTARENEICRKWIDHFLGGFHPDTPGADYVADGVRFLSDVEAAEYDRDMNELFSIDCDPYGVALGEMRKAGILD